MKQCSKCGELKDDTDFYNSHNQCKECMRQYSKRYDLNHKEEREQYRLYHKEEKKQYSKQYRLEHKKKIKQYYLNNKEKIKHRSKKYRLNNKEKIKQYRIDHKEGRKQNDIKHKEERQQYKKRYRLEHKDELKQYNKQYRQSEAGKITRKKHKAKRRNIKYIQLMNNPFPKDVVVEDHHILNNFHAIDAESTWNKWFVIPMPKLTHRFINGNANSLAHWRYNEEWIRKLYNINIKELLGIEKN